MNYSLINEILASVQVAQPTIFDETFYEMNADGLGLAYLVYEGFAIATEEGQDMINTTWQDFCMYTGIDTDIDSMDDFASDFLDGWEIRE